MVKAALGRINPNVIRTAVTKARCGCLRQINSTLVETRQLMK